MSLTVIIPVYNEALSVINIGCEIDEILASTTLSYTILFIDDGSRDQSWRNICILTENKPQVFKGIRLTKNFGKDYAVLSGLVHAHSDLYLTIDADGEHPTDRILDFIDLQRSTQCDVVHGIKSERSTGKKSYNFLANSFNYIFGILTGLNSEQSSDFKLFTHQFKKKLLQYVDSPFYFRMAALEVGGYAHNLLITPKRTHKKSSSWPKLRLYKYAANAIINYSYVPLYFVLLMGIISLLFTAGLGAKTIIHYYLGIFTRGYPTLLLVALISFSFIMITLGVISVYLSRIHQKLRNAPLYHIHEMTTETMNTPTARHYVTLKESSSRSN